MINFINIGNRAEVRAFSSITIYSLILLLSSFLYSYTRVFWLFELPPFIFCTTVSILAVLLLGFSRNCLCFSVNDLLIICFFVYMIAGTVIMSYGGIVVSDRIYFAIGYFIFFLLFKHLITFLNLGWIIRIIFAVALLQSILGILQYLHLLPFSFNKVTGIRGTLFYSNVYGCLMAIGLCINVSMILRANKKQWQLLLLLPLCLFLPTLLLSLSRTAFIAALLGVTLVSISHFGISKRDIKPKHIFFGFLSFIAVATFVICLNFDSISGRFIIWRISLTMFMAHPILGNGYGAFFTQYGNYQADFFLSQQRVDDIANIAGMNYHSFNEFVKIGIENGVIGILFALVILISILKASLKFTGDVIWVTILAIIMMFCTVSYPFTDISITVIFITCICALTKDEKAYLVVNLKPFYNYLMIGTLIVTIGLGSIKISAIVKWGEFQDALRYESKNGLDGYRKLYPVLSNNGSFLYNYGAELAEAGENVQSLQILKRASYYGTSVELYTALGNNYFLAKDYAKAEFCLLRAAYMVPKKFVPFNNLLEFYKKTDQMTKARQVAQIICQKPIKVASLSADEIKSKASTFLNKTNDTQ